MVERVVVVARRWDARLLLVWSLLALGWVFPGAVSAAAGPSFTPLSGSMAIPRFGARAAPLPNGDVLIAGGFPNLSSAEVFDPSTGAFTLLPQSMTTARYDAAMAPLADGDVLIAGGAEDNNGAGTDQFLSSAELFDPLTGKFTALPGSMTTARSGAVAAPLPDGDVLIAGGENGGGTLSSAELFDPSTGKFARLPGSMTTPRYGAVAAPLPRGDVLIAGGENRVSYLSSAEVFDGTGFTLLPASMQVASWGAAAAPLPGGDVLIAGGLAGGYGQVEHIQSTAELFDPSTGVFTVLPVSLTAPRYEAVAAPLPNGDVLIGGGQSGSDVVASAEVFDMAQQVATTGAPDGRSKWTLSLVGRDERLSAVSCVAQWRGPASSPSLPRSWCMAVGGYPGLESIAWSGVSQPTPVGSAQPDSPPANIIFPSLLGVSCATAKSGPWCVAVGDRWVDAVRGGVKENLEVPLIERWNGARWALQSPPPPLPGVVGSYLEAVSCVRSGACEAVGETQTNRSAGSVPLIERWDGSRSQLQEAPSDAGALTSVSCAAPDACMAVGSSGSIVRWNGTRWSSDAGAVSGTLHGVSCPLTNRCIAVGSTGAGALAESWNGSYWSAQLAQDVPGDSDELDSISCATTKSCIAVGRSCLEFAFCPLTERLTGAAWVVEATPLTSSGNPGNLSSVSCKQLMGCVAVGAWSLSAVIERRSAAPKGVVSVSDVHVSRTGVLRFQASVPKPGTLDVMETAWESDLVRAAVVLQPAPARFVFARGVIPVTTSGTITGTVQPYSRGRQLLAHHSYPIMLRVWVSFTPRGGHPETVGFYGVHLAGGLVASR